MGWSNGTLILLRKAEDPKRFLVDLHQHLESISLRIDISDEEFISFNSLVSDEEKEYEMLSDSMSTEDVIEILCSWKGLGMLTYRHGNFTYPIVISFLSWNEDTLQGLAVSFNGKEPDHDRLLKEDQLVMQIASFLDYQLIVTDIHDIPDHLYYPGYPNDLNSVKKNLETQEFRIRIEK